MAIKLNGIISPDNFYVYPNPFTSDFKVGITCEADVTAIFRIISFEGKEMDNRKVSLEKGENLVVMKDMGFLAKGSYILEVSTGTGKFIKKIIKR